MNKPDDTPAVLSEVEVLAPIGGAQALGDLVSAPRDRLDPVFSERRLAALNALSQELLKHPLLKRDPAAVALAFWLRAGSLKPVFDGYVSRQTPQVVTVPAGLVFHIAPANVDTMFVYSWALSFAAGNADVVRLSSERSLLIGGILECINTCAKASPVAWAGSFFVGYAHSEAVTALFSRVCDQRVIWGGDETVRRIRAVPLNPHAGERAFASKFSMAVFDAAAFVGAHSEQRSDVLKKLVLDIVSFGQNACSSPHMLIWLGTTGQVEGAIKSFEEELAAPAEDENDLARAVRRVATTFEAAASEPVGWERVHQSRRLWSLRDKELMGFDRTAIGAGVIRHGRVATVTELARKCRSGDQTISYWGLSLPVLHELAIAAGARGVDRLVPVGRALDFGVIWDGISLLDDFVRKVSLLK
jgi:hypothetical protein